MKRLGLLLLLIMLVPFVSAQTIGTANITATGAFTLSAGQTLTLSAQIVGCNGDLPTYQGNPISITPNQTASTPFTANGSEVVSFTLPGNDQILCGGQDYSLYAVTWKINGHPAGPTKTYRFVDGTSINLNTATATGFVPPIINNTIGAQCAAGTILNGFNPDFTPVCEVDGTSLFGVSADANGNLTVTGSINGVPASVFAFLDPTSSIQTQFDALSNELGNKQAVIPGLSSDSANGINVTGAVAASKVNGVYDYCAANGMHCDGATDDTAAFNALLQKVYDDGGGTIQGSCGKTSLILGQITFPNDGQNFPAQHGVRVEGCASNSSFSQASNGGAFTLDMRDNAAVAKVLTEGTGTLEISGVNFVDGGTDCAAFIFDSNTTLYLHNNVFQGTATGASACNDAVILGGTDPSTRSGSNASFQGYGTVVRENTFNKIRRAVLAQNWANAIVIRDNAITSNSGNPTGAAIQFSSKFVSGFDNGLSDEQVVGNIIESNNYEYGIILGTSGAGGYSVSASYIAGNGCYDHGGVFSACVFIQGVTPTSGGGNVVFGGATDVSADATYNTIVNGVNGLFDANLIEARFSLTTPKVLTQAIFTDGTGGGFAIVNDHNGTLDFSISNAGASSDHEIALDFADQNGVTHTRIRDVPDSGGRDTYIQNNVTGFMLGSLIFDGTTAFGNPNKSTYLHGLNLNLDSNAVFHVGGTGGVTGSVTAGNCTFTATGGVITAMTGTDCGTGGAANLLAQTVTITPLAAAGSGATAICTSGFTCTADHGMITITPGASGRGTFTTYIQVSWSSALPANANCEVYSASITIGGWLIRSTDESTTSFKIDFNNGSTSWTGTMDLGYKCSY